MTSILLKGMIIVILSAGLASAEPGSSPRTEGARSAALSPDVREAAQRIETARLAMHPMNSSIDQLVQEAGRIEAILNALADSRTSEDAARLSEDLGAESRRVRGLLPSFAGSLSLESRDLLSAKLTRIDEIAATRDPSVARELVMEIQSSEYRRPRAQLAPADTLLLAPIFPAPGARNELEAAVEGPHRSQIPDVRP